MRISIDKSKYPTYQPTDRASAPACCKIEIGMSEAASVTRLDDLLDFGQLF